MVKRTLCDPNFIYNHLDGGLLVAKGEEEVFTIAGGVVEVQPKLITVLADRAENVAEIDVSRAEEARKRAQDILKEGPPKDTDAYLRLEAALRRSNLRLEAVRRFRGGERRRMPSMSQTESD